MVRAQNGTAQKPASEIEFSPFREIAILDSASFYRDTHLLILRGAFSLDYGTRLHALGNAHDSKDFWAIREIALRTPFADSGKHALNTLFCEGRKFELLDIAYEAKCPEVSRLAGHLAKKLE